MNNQQNQEQGNKIAYDLRLRDQLRTLHELMGFEIAGIASRAIEPGIRLSDETQKAMVTMSEEASKLTLFLLEARKRNNKLTEQEQRDYERISAAAAALGNLQAKVNTILKFSREINGLNRRLKEAAISLAEDTMDSQQQFREIRAGINDLGMLSRDPDMAFELSEHRRRNSNIA